MAINTIWVYAEVADGKPTAGTLELLTKARSLGAGTVAAFVVGDVGDAAATLGAFGAATVYATGDLGGKLPGPAGSGAIKALIDGGTSPDLILFPSTYGARDVAARLSVKLDKTVLTNNTGIKMAAACGTLTARAIIGTAKEPKPAPKPLLLIPNSSTAGTATM